MRFSEVRAGLESSIHGFATSIGPVLVFAGLFGSVSLAAALWATLVTAVCVPLASVLLRAHPSIHASSRAASLLAYAALVLQLSLANVASVGHQSLPTAAEFASGLAAASLLFALASSLIMLAGFLRLGHVFKMIPSTVTAGISNSTAALLVLIACRQLWSSPLQALAAAILMVLAYWGWSQSQQRWPVLRVVPNVLVAVLVGLCLSGWLAEPVSAAATVADVSWNTQWMGVVLWPQLLGQDHLIELLWIGIPGMLTLALVMILESHTACSTMEARFGVRIQANHELLVLGCTNLLCAALGGVPSTGSPIRCISNWMAGGRGKSAVAVAALITGGLVLALGQWLLAIPVGVIAGLFLLQAPLMVDPLFKQQLWRVLNKPRIQSAGVADLGFWITLVITLAGVVGNLIWACFLGVGLSCLVILRRVSGSLTSRWVYLDQCRSRRVRSLSDVAALERSAHQVAVLALSGHLFFGNSARLTQLVDELHPAVCAVVVDISQLEDVDPSGLEALHRLLRALLERQLRVVLSGEQQVAVPDLQQLLPQNQDLVRSIDQDRGLEFCEDLLLSQLQPASSDPGYVSCAHNLLLLGLDEAGVQLVRALGEVRELQMAQDLFRCHDTADGIWLLEQGRVSILSGAADQTRLATLGPGQFVGEMGFVDQQSRSATARAETPIKAVFLSHAKLLGLTQQQPEVALNLALNIARAISLRMRNSVFR